MKEVGISSSSAEVIGVMTGGKEDDESGDSESESESSDDENGDKKMVTV